ncbi:uncharacterized protein BDZ99DRAFT_479601 [Mytilinidion resinicola]|uniref:DUF3295 domain-containing protein n=1 Tax=Mytilinidion resinicola TaxID=574789 RepID=A0A6A6YEQ1_9PEZI|nr:uncharacterized protein BDZ99DRAFT_479601 [Mytilinidion resinicola]KAF2806337.1 hypothetical protein BDZ99DRAFT_479601 [Mytilinidion resinicola]
MDRAYSHPPHGILGNQLLGHSEIIRYGSTTRSFGANVKRIPMGSAIEDEWEDEGSNVPPGVMTLERCNTSPMFTRPSLLTKLFHDHGAQLMQNPSLQSTPKPPNGPFTSHFPQEDSSLVRPHVFRPMATSTVHSRATSPHTTRRNMLETELPETLRWNLLREREEKKATINVVKKRLQTAELAVPRTRNEIEGDLQDYYQKGW